jgi:hypothetical protein
LRFSGKLDVVILKVNPVFQIHIDSSADVCLVWTLADTPLRVGAFLFRVIFPNAFTVSIRGVYARNHFVEGISGEVVKRRLKVVDPYSRTNTTESDTQDPVFSISFGLMWYLVSEVSLLCILHVGRIVCHPVCQDLLP